ncbi:MAG: ABC transporter ATP-binding protein, partial [Pseudomonadota bacterium]
MSALIKVNGLTKRFGHLSAVDDISMSAKRGEVLGFLGPNGAGKSTTMKMITGYLTPTAGQIEVAGHDVLTAPLEAKKRIGYLPEGAPAYGEMTPASFLAFIAEVRAIPAVQRRRRIEQVVES